MAVHLHSELRPLRIAGIELAVAVGVEDMPQRLKVARRRRIPFREGKFARPRDLAVAVSIDDKHADAGSGPSSTMLVAVTVEIQELRRGRQGLDAQAVAAQIKKNRPRRGAPVAAGAWAVIAATMGVGAVA